jgi:hypothetical protein
MRKPALLAFIVVLAFSSVSAQKAVISGIVRDTSEKKNLSLAAVTLLRKADTTLVSFTRTNADGKFLLPATDTGNYVLLVTYPHFADYMDDVQVKGNIDLGNILLTMKSKLLDEVVLKTVAAIRIKGDTTEFVADSFKVKEGATVEDLLKKLPGFSGG